MRITPCRIILSIVHRVVLHRNYYAPYDAIMIWLRKTCLCYGSIHNTHYSTSYVVALRMLRCAALLHVIASLVASYSTQEASARLKSRGQKCVGRAKHSHIHILIGRRINYVCINIYIYIYILYICVYCVHACVYIYIYIYIERERDIH